LLPALIAGIQSFGTVRGIFKATVTFEGRNQPNTAFIRQISAQCDETADITVVSPDDKQKAVFALVDLKRHGKPEGMVFAALAKALSPLPETADELREVAKQLGAGPEDIKLREAATVTDVKHERLSDYRVVYFATRALVAGEIHSDPPLHKPRLRANENCCFIVVSVWAAWFSVPA
jgi:hypothetical protein